ncbi:hypothetical protein IMG5_150790 [Ichthyophthirius multifiliis]|uniref:Catalase n=1 Tax=Ichthyophthirius multifiliis TaxID=5932 RepID=G0QYM7_ICHMU|nr:hypothetical protein IMG5_150790 [Ichthyophthirius multifiliis]EGR29683.1 hypothetical protein IMG5_150790 [Ichthyophthirius multifiliis]|eukprot:XP_004030919.1 hypothetical protein IMG5_150790 [Ichthyophthirius multifiliis]
MNNLLKILALTCLIVLITCQKYSGEDYQKQTRQEKLSQLLEEILKDSTPGNFPSTLSLAGIFTESMKVTMNLQSDQFPEGRKKFIHSVGNVAHAQFQAEPDTPYTGFFKGADSLLIRLSCAKKPNPTKEPLNNFIPGIALKYLVDGQPSANLVAMNSVNGIPSWNFFAEEISNHIGLASGLSLKLLSQKFASATKQIQTVGLKAFASHDQNGKAVDNVKYPWKLIFRAPDNIKEMFSDTFKNYYTDQLKTIPAETVLYEVFAVENPEDGCQKKIGKIFLKSKLNTSKFGDQQLFFQHQDMENDLKERPQWRDYTPSWSFWNIFNTPDKQTKKIEGKCPFKQMFQY